MWVKLPDQVAPCKGCADRTIEPNCHMTCDRYLSFKGFAENYRKKHRQDKENVTASRGHREADKEVQEMKVQEFENTKRKIRNNFIRGQAVILELLLKHVRDIEENERLIKIRLGLQDQTMQLLKENSDLKIAMLTKRLLESGVPISSEDLLTTYHKKEEVEDDEGVSGTDGVHGMDSEEE